MATISPFPALRPDPALASQVASRPYDVLNSTEARVDAAGNPASFLHITKSEIDLPEDMDTHSQQVYDRANENLQSFIQKHILLREEKPCYYIYRLVMNGRNQTGLVAVSSVDDYEKGVIRKHELTRPDKEADRINHMKTIGAQTGNVFLAYKNVAAIDKLIEDWKSAHEPVYDFTADDGISHTVWIVDAEDTVQTITRLFAADVPFTYIADGHHRAASAAKVRKTLGPDASPAAGFFLTTLFPSAELHILDYNRLVKDLNGATAEEFVDSLQKDFFVGRVDKAFSPEQLHQFGLYLEGSWHKLVAKDGSFTTDPIGVLDVTILQKNILDKLLAIKDPRTDKRIDFVGGIRGLAELEKRVDSGEMQAAFSLYPVSIQQLFDIADSGQVMPPKSTWFEPKLRDGLLTHVFRLLILVPLLGLLHLNSFAQDTDAKTSDAKTSQENAKAFARTGDYTNALLVLNHALQKDPKNLDLQKDLAFDYYLQKEYAKGIDIAKPLTERSDADVQCYQIAGLFYKAMDEASACERLYKAGIKRWPKSGVLYNEYGEVLSVKQDYAAIKQWEKGIEVDPNYSSNYYNASKYYFFTNDKVWSLIYGEIFLNLESYSKRTAEMKELLLEGYKKLYSDADVSKNQNIKSAFAGAWLSVMNKVSPAIAQGVTTESLTVLRTEFIIKWFETYPANFPFRLFDYQRQLLKDGLFDAYNEWIFGAAADLPVFQAWTNTHNEDYNRFTNFQKGRIFKLPEGQYYQTMAK